MKILVKKIKSEFKTGSGRCSDGWHVDVNYTDSVKIFSDCEKVSLSQSIMIIDFINKHSSSYNDREFGGWSGDKIIETFDINLANEIKSIFIDEIIEITEIEEECSYLLNSIAEKIIESHKTAVVELKNKHSIIYQKYLTDLEITKAEIAKEAFYSNEGVYDVNEIMPDFNEFPLDIARLCDDAIFFEYLLSRKSANVKDSYVFAEWICKIGKFEYLERFVDLSKLQLIRTGSSIDNSQLKNYRLTECILYYAIANNRLDIFNKFGNERFGKTISEVNYSESKTNFYSYNYISIGLIAVKHSNIEIVKELYGKCSFYENIKYKHGSTKSILSEYCFRDLDTAYFFVDKLATESIFAILYWNKVELLQLLIESNKTNLSKIYLSAFRDFFTQENNCIIEQLATINSFSLAKVINIDHNSELSKRSVLEECATSKNFVLLKKLFYICIEREEFTSFDACRLLFFLYKYDENQESEDLKQIILKIINPDDLKKLLGVACMEKNLGLLKLLIKQVNEINTSIELEPTSYGLEGYRGFVSNILKEYKKGTLLHLSLLANPNQPGRWLDIKIIKSLLDAGVDKSIKDESGKLAFDYIAKCYNYREDTQQKKELVTLLYQEGIKICSNNGELITFLKGTELPIIKEFEGYLSRGINAVTALKNNNKEALSFFLSCGAEIESLKSLVEMENRREKIVNDSSNYGYSDSYTEQDLRDMYRDAFDGFDDAVWNID